MQTYSDWRTGVEDSLTAHKAFSSVHGDGPDHTLSQVLRNLKHQANLVVEDLQTRENRRQALLEPDVDDGSDDLANLADGAGTSELISDLSARAAGCFRWRWLYSRLRRSSGGGGEVDGTVEKEALGRRAVRGAWRGRCSEGRSGRRSVYGSSEERRQ